MKRKIAWLALPLVLFALVSNAEARMKRPKATNEDLKIQALLSKASEIQFQFFSTNEEYEIEATPRELKSLPSQFFFSTQQKIPNKISQKANDTIGILYSITEQGKSGIVVFVIDINLNSYKGTSFDWRSNALKPKNLHPFTVKRWIELLLNHPRIGPEIRARLK